MDWARLASRFRCRIITQEFYDEHMTSVDRHMTYFVRIIVLRLPVREKGMAGGFRFIFRMERAFVETNLPADIQSLFISDHIGPSFFKWYSRTKVDILQYIP